MKLIAKLALCLALTLPLAAQAHGKKEHAPGACDMQGMDMSKISADEHQKMMQQCPHGAAQPKGGS